MAQVNFRVDDELKTEAEKVCEAMGLSMSAALNVFLKKMVKERRIPFEITADPFYSNENIRELKSRIADIEAGRNMHEHDLIEVD